MIMNADSRKERIGRKDEDVVHESDLAFEIMAVRQLVLVRQTRGRTWWG